MYLVSIILPVHPAHNSDSILGECLRSLSNQTYPKNKIELILIGDGCNPNVDLSYQGIKTKIYNFPCRVGVAKTRNKGITLSQGQFIAFIDADCVAEEDWLKNLVGGFKNDDIGGCGGRILDLKNRCVNKDRVHGSEIPLSFTGLSNAIFRREVLEEIGFLDERFFMRSEDVDLSWRIYLKGYRIEYIAEAVVVHKGTPDAKESFSYGIGARILINKYKEIFNLLPPFELRRYIKILKQSLKEGIFLSKIISSFIIFLGYTYTLLKEKLHLSKRLEQVTLTDKFLQPASSIKPLAVTTNSKSLIKPNYIIWWRSENGCRVFDLKSQRHYTLEDVSSKIWEYMMAKNPKDTIIAQLIAEYNVDKEKLEEDFAEFIEYLHKEHILELFG